MMGTTGMFIFLLIVGFVTGGIGFLVYYILLEMAHISGYALALIVMLVSLMELGKFIMYIFTDQNIEINPKAIFAKIKSLFKKNKETKNDYELNKIVKKDRNKFVIIVECLIIIAFVVYSLIKLPHGILLNFTYNGWICRILSGIYFPLLVINIINYTRDEGFGYSFPILFLEYVFGFIFATTFVFAADTAFKDSPQAKNTLTSCFVYDDDSYDKIRSKEKITDNFEFLKTSYLNTLEELSKTYNINEEDDYSKLKEDLLTKVKLERYGFKMTDHKWIDDDSVILYIVDRKTNKYNYYKLNIRTNSFEKSNNEEWKESTKK